MCFDRNASAPDWQPQSQRVWHVLQNLYNVLMRPEEALVGVSNTDAAQQIQDNVEMFLQFAKQSAKESVLTANAIAKGSTSVNVGIEMGPP